MWSTTGHFRLAYNARSTSFRGVLLPDQLEKAWPENARRRHGTRRAECICALRFILQREGLLEQSTSSARRPDDMWRHDVITRCTGGPVRGSALHARGPEERHPCPPLQEGHHAVCDVPGAGRGDRRGHGSGSLHPQLLVRPAADPANGPRPRHLRSPISPPVACSLSVDSSQVGQKHRGCGSSRSLLWLAVDSWFSRRALLYV